MAAEMGAEEGPGPRVVMYSRRTCGLCDKARAVIMAERRRSAFQFQEVYIDGEEGLERAHGLRVPVVEIDGVERFETVVDPAGFAMAVRPAGTSPARPGRRRARLRRRPS